MKPLYGSRWEGEEVAQLVVMREREREINLRNWDIRIQNSCQSMIYKLTQEEVVLLQVVRQYTPVTLTPLFRNNFTKQQHKWYSDVWILPKLNMKKTKRTSTNNLNGRHYTIQTNS